LLQQVAPLGKATILDVMCHTGYPGLELLRRFPQARVFAVDPSSALLEVARNKAGAHASRRAFFRTEPAEPRLPYDDGVYDLVISNLGLYDVAQPRLLLRELARVAKPGAQVLCTLPLRGTFNEFYALLRSLCDEPGREKEAARLRIHESQWPAARTVLGWAAEAGLIDLELVCAPFSLLVGGGTDMFFAPLFEYGPLTAWKSILGGVGPQLQTGFAKLRDAIDRSCSGQGSPQLAARPEHIRSRPVPFSLTVRAACLRARRPMPAPFPEPQPAEPSDPRRQS
jgi:SAM-dependent methyltransferase